MEQRVIYVFTHDSIGVGEDGATHQPVEQLANLRAIPRLIVIRPCDANETACAWRVAIETRDRPVALILTRQDVPTLDRNRYASAEGLRRGAYILAEAENGRPELILIATGSEVDLDRRSAAATSEAGHSNAPRVHAQLGIVRYPDGGIPPLSISSVRPRTARRGSGCDPGVASLHRRRGRRDWPRPFRRLRPGPVLMREFGFTAENVCKRALALLEKNNA